MANVTYATRTGNPEAQDVHLLVEISDATLDYDRTVTFDSPFCGKLPVEELLPAPLPADK